MSGPVSPEPEIVTPPLGGHAPPFRCGRLMAWPDESSHCPQEATTHIIWTADIDNGLACYEHAIEAKEKFDFVAMHPYEMACSMPGSIFLSDENRCAPPDVDQLLVAETAEVAS